MSEQNYTTSFIVDQSPEEVFAAVNNVRGWWSGEIEGGTDKLVGGNLLKLIATGKSQPSPW
jgi:hypothetical protein